MSGGAAEARPWGLWGRQILAILRLEARKSFIGRRAIPIYLLALMPVLLFAFRAIVLRTIMAPEDEAWAQAIQEDRSLFSAIFQTFMMRFMLFFGCVGIFTNLFRGEMIDKSLHYYFLVPVRREILAAGKYLAGLITALVVFNLSTGLSMVLLYSPYGTRVVIENVLTGTGFVHLLTYLWITTLACVGYGGVFLAIGLLFRNPVVPAVGILGWEFLNFLLPPLLKKISVVFYLNSLQPVPISQGPFAIVAEPASAWLAVPLLLGVTVVCLAVAAWRVRRLEVLYGLD